LSKRCLYIPEATTKCRCSNRNEKASYVKMTEKCKVNAFGYEFGDVIM